MSGVEPWMPSLTITGLPSMCIRDPSEEPAMNIYRPSAGAFR